MSSGGGAAAAGGGSSKVTYEGGRPSIAVCIKVINPSNLSSSGQNVSQPATASSGARSTSSHTVDYDFPVYPDETVGRLKMRLASLINIPSNKQRLVYAGTQHPDGSRCEEVLSRGKYPMNNNRISLYIVRILSPATTRGGGRPGRAGSGYATGSSKTIDTTDLQYRATYERCAGGKTGWDPTDDGEDEWNGDDDDGNNSKDQNKRRKKRDDDDDDRMIDPGCDDTSIAGGGPETRRRESMLQVARSHFESYRHALIVQNKDIVLTTGDGNCLFRAISHQIYGEERHHLLVRRKCVEYMSHNVEHFSAACQALRGADGNFQTYLSIMAKDAREGGEQAWGDHPEISACAEIYNRQIEIWTYNVGGNNAHVQEHCRFGSGYQQNDLEVNIPVRLSFYKGGHYDSIVGRGWQENWTTRLPGQTEDAAIALAKARAPGYFDAAIRASREEAKKAEGKSMDMLIIQRVMEDSERQHVEDEFVKDALEASARNFQAEQDRIESNAVREAMVASARELAAEEERQRMATNRQRRAANNNADRQSPTNPFETRRNNNNNGSDDEGGAGGVSETFVSLASNKPSSTANPANNGGGGITADMKDVMVESAVGQVRNFGCEHFPVGLIKHALRENQNKEDGVIDIEAAIGWLFAEGERYLAQNLHLYKYGQEVGSGGRSGTAVAFAGSGGTGTKK